MLKTIRGVVVSETPYQENSKILNILTRDGIIGVLSKGSKKLKSPLRLVSQKLVYGDFTVYYVENHLSTLKEGSIVNELRNIHSDLDKLSYVSYITELTSQIMKQNNNFEIYDMYISTLIKINDGLNPKVMMNILEIKLLDYLGVGINLNGCNKCGSTKAILTIDPDAGGYICQSCYNNEPIYDERVRKMLRMYYLVDINSIKELDIKDYVIDAINKFLSVYYDKYTGLYIHSKKFLNRELIGFV